MKKTLSVAEIQAVAGAAITARHAATAAKSALDAAPDDESLKSAYTAAEQKAQEAEAAAEALSHESEPGPDAEKRKQKLLRKRSIINRELQDDFGIPSVRNTDDEGDEDDDDEDEAEDLERPVTFGDLKRIERQNAAKSALEMVNAIQDATARDAVKAALKRVVPSGDPQKDFTDAVAIASRDKNSKVLEEVARKIRPQQHRSGAGAPARAEDPEFEPTAEEAKFMRHPFNLSKEQILAARPK